MLIMEDNVNSLKAYILKPIILAFLIFILCSHHLTTYAGTGKESTLSGIINSDTVESVVENAYSEAFAQYAQDSGSTMDTDELKELGKESYEKLKNSGGLDDSDELEEYIKNEVKNGDYGITFDKSSSKMKKINEDPLGNIGEDSTDTTQIKLLGGGAISIIRTFAVLGMVISIVTGAITLMVNGYKAKNTVASDVSAKLLVIIVIGGLSFVVNVVLTIAKAL